MKNILMMSAAAIVTAGAASADVNLSGYGRFGLTYNDGVHAGIAQTQIDTRFRLNIDASMTSDVGVEFGGRVRLQYDDNSATSVLTSTPTATGGVVNTTTTTGSGAQLSPADLYAKFGGLRVDVGNVGTAFDNAALMYNSEVGYIGNSGGDPLGYVLRFRQRPLRRQPGQPHGRGRGLLLRRRKRPRVDREPEPAAGRPAGRSGHRVRHLR